MNVANEERLTVHMIIYNVILLPCMYCADSYIFMALFPFMYVCMYVCVCVCVCVCVVCCDSALANGGALSLEETGNVTFFEAKFTNNSAGVNGGAVSVLVAEGVSGFVDVSGSLFDNNTATPLMGGDDDVNGGALFVEDATNVTLAASSFRSNFALKDGGGVDIKDVLGDVNVISCFFDNNAVADEGGALKIVAEDTNTNVSVTFSTFVNNTSVEEGGAIIIEDAGSATFRGSDFRLNKCEKDGGAITFDAIERTVVIDSCTFTNNTSMDQGGAIDYDASSGSPNAQLIVCGSRFANNTSLDNDAGALYVKDADFATVTNSEFVGNVCFDDGAGLVFDGVGARAVVSNCNFTANIAGASGGGLYTEDSVGKSLEVLGCNFIGNSISDPPTGTPNDFDGVPGDGGGAFITGGFGGADADLVISGCTFQNNTVPDDGGGLFIVAVSNGTDPNPGNITLRANIFEDNVAGMYFSHLSVSVSLSRARARVCVCVLSLCVCVLVHSSACVQIHTRTQTAGGGGGGLSFGRQKREPGLCLTGFALSLCRTHTSLIAYRGPRWSTRCRQLARIFRS